MSDPLPYINQEVLVHVDGETHPGTVTGVGPMVFEVSWTETRTARFVVATGLGSNGKRVEPRGSASAATAPPA